MAKCNVLISSKLWTPKSWVYKRNPVEPWACLHAIEKKIRHSWSPTKEREKQETGGSWKLWAKHFWKIKSKNTHVCLVVERCYWLLSVWCLIQLICTVTREKEFATDSPCALSHCWGFGVLLVLFAVGLALAQSVSPMGVYWAVVSGPFADTHPQGLICIIQATWNMTGYLRVVRITLCLGTWGTIC